MKGYHADICKCPVCHYYDMDKPHRCGLPGQFKKKDIPHIRNAVHHCHCVNPNLWHFYDSLEVGR